MQTYLLILSREEILYINTQRARAQRRPAVILGGRKKISITDKRKNSLIKIVLTTYIYPRRGG